ncbi:MAG: fatty acid desaturase family protein, partial [Acidimicrobiales bacterium]
MTLILERPPVATTDEQTTSLAPLTTAERYGLSPEQLDQIGRELDAIRERVLADRGDADVAYLRRIIRWQRGLAATGRASLFLGFLPPFWIGGTLALGLAKILDNMEIGHNVMHGQYDWTRDPALQSQTFEWDAASPADQWRHSHNYLHHTFTNIQGKDRDLGYGIL